METKVLLLFADLMEAVEAMHMLGLVHLDISPENICVVPCVVPLPPGDAGGVRERWEAGNVRNVREQAAAQQTVSPRDGGWGGASEGKEKEAPAERITLKLLDYGMSR